MWYQEIIDVRDRGAKTGIGAGWESEADARDNFERVRPMEVGPDRVEFLVDLHDPADNLVDTIRIDAEAFEAIVGAPPDSAAHYLTIDRDYWVRARALRKNALTRDRRPGRGS